MPTADDLCGLGVAPGVAAELGNSPASLTGVGTAQTGAAVIKTHLTEMTTGASTYAFIIRSSAKSGTPYWVYNTSSTSAVVYPPVGHYLNGTQNAGLTVAQTKAAILIQYKKSYWMSLLTA